MQPPSSFGCTNFLSIFFFPQLCSFYKHVACLLPSTCYRKASQSNLCFMGFTLLWLHRALDSMGFTLLWLHRPLGSSSVSSFLALYSNSVCDFFLCLPSFFYYRTWTLKVVKLRCLYLHWKYPHSFSFLWCW